MIFLGCFLVFSALALGPGVLVHGLVCDLIQKVFPERNGSTSALFPLSAAVGLVGFLVCFSLAGRVIAPFAILVPLSFVTSVVILGLVIVPLENAPLALGLRNAVNPFSLQNRSRMREALPAIALILAFQLVLLALRATFANIEFEVGRFGAEKLFNLQFQQAFVHGAGYPPETLWFAGEPIAYYLLPKALPGLASYLMRVLFGEPLTGGVMFHLGDTFSVAFGASVAFAGLSLVLTDALGSEQARKGTMAKGFAVAIACVLALVPFLAAPARELAQAAGGRIDLWSLSRIIDNTVNEYPYWNFLWADNHAHSLVIFMSLSLFLWVHLLLESTSGKRQDVQFALAFLVGLTAAAIQMSHSGSVLIALVVLGPTALLRIALGPASERLAKLRALAFAGVFAGIFALPDLVQRAQARVKWFFVPRDLATSLSDFTNVNCTILVCIAVLALASALGQSGRLRRITAAGVASAAAPCLVLFALGRPAVALVVAISEVLVFLSLPRDTSVSEAAGPVSLIVGVLLVWVFPEFLVANWDMGPSYIRYNTVFRFLFESFYLVPFALSIALARPLARLIKGAHGAPARRGIVLVPCAVLVAFLCATTLAHVRVLENRRQRVPMAPTLDGFSFLESARPHDWRLIQFLAGLPGRVVIAEECAIAPKPGNYTVLGRMSAYSARPAICGWANHMMLFYYNAPSGPSAPDAVYSSLLRRDAWTRALMNVGSLPGLTPESDVVREALAGFHVLGVTHLVIGEAERSILPERSIDKLSGIGEVVFQDGPYGIVKLGSPSKDARPND